MPPERKLPELPPTAAYSARDHLRGHESALASPSRRPIGGAASKKRPGRALPRAGQRARNIPQLQWPLSEGGF